MIFISQQKHYLCYNVCLWECVYHVCVCVCVCACVYGYVSFFCIGDILQSQPFIWVCIFPGLCQILYGKKNPQKKKKAFFFGHSIDSYGRVKFLWPGYIFLLFLLHPHKIIESTQIFLCVLRAQVWQNSIKKPRSFFMNSSLFGSGSNWPTRDSFVTFFFTPT